jgi:hypothetical protein
MSHCAKLSLFIREGTTQMAEMIPETLSSSDSATNGEKRVFRLLRDALLPDEDFLVWFEPKAIKRRPDFLVWSHELGLLVP